MSLKVDNNYELDEVFRQLDEVRAEIDSIDNEELYWQLVGEERDLLTYIEYLERV